MIIEKISKGGISVEKVFEALRLVTQFCID